MNGAERIAAERKRQIEVEGYTPEHDAEHTGADLLHASRCYLIAADMEQWKHSYSYVHALPERPPEAWPWERAAWKPSSDPIRNLEKAGALIAAEIDRLLAREET